MGSEPFGSATVRRVEWLTLLLGGLGTVWAAWHWGWRGGAGLAIGAVLSWINFRWLKGGVQAFGATAVALESAANEQAVSAPRPAPVAKKAYFKFLARFGLLLAAVYVILTRTPFPPLSVLAGLFAAAAGVVIGLMIELAASGVADLRRG